MHHATVVARALVLALLTGLGLALAAPLAAAAESGASLTGVVNVNTATLDELQLLPGVGASRARALIALRKKRGGFKSVDQLVDVKGIGPTGLERIRPFVALTGKTTAQIK